MYHILHFIFSIFVIFILAALVSKNYKNIKIRFVLQLLLIEILLAYFFLNFHYGLKVIQYLSSLFNKLLFFANEGTEFVFGNMNKYELSFFFLKVLCPIVFISSLIGILQYLRILPMIIYIIGTILSKINGMGKLESFNAISSLILGQSENFIAYKNILNSISERQMYTMAATSMSTVSISIVGSYMTILEPKYVVVALILNMFSSFIILSLLNPYTIEEEKNINIKYFQKNKGFFEIIEEYILIGFKIAVVVAAMLIGFIALISTINYIFFIIFGINFTNILGYLFSPIAYIMGIPINESLKSGNIMATKLVSNEFIAMMNLKKISNELSSNSVSILSVFLVSFANFSSIGIIIGSIKCLNKHQGNIISKHSLKLIYGATLVSILSATITGFIIK